MDRVTIPGVPKHSAETRFIQSNDNRQIDIEFNECSPQLVLLNFNPGEKRPLHKHAELRVTFIRSGMADFIVNGEHKSAKSGDLIMLMPDAEHSLEVIGSEPLIIAEMVIPV